MEENFQIRNEAVENILRNTGNSIKNGMPPGMGFALLLFDYGEGGNLFYCSSAKREDVVKTMQEFINKN